MGGLAARMNERLELVDPNTLNCSLGHCSWFGYILQIDNSYLLKSIQTVVSQYYNILVNETRDHDVLNICTTRVISQSAQRWYTTKWSIAMCYFEKMHDCQVPHKITVSRCRGNCKMLS